SYSLSLHDALPILPSFARGLLEAVESRDMAGSLTALTHVLLAGEALPGELAADLRAALPGARLINLYGATETILATWHEVTEPGGGAVPIGRPIPGRHVLVLDDLDRPCPPGVTGHLVVRSPYVALGYVEEEADAERAFRPVRGLERFGAGDRKSTRLNSSHVKISYAVFCLKKKTHEMGRLDD